MLSMISPYCLVVSMIRTRLVAASLAKAANLSLILYNNSTLA